MTDSAAPLALSSGVALFCLSCHRPFIAHRATRKYCDSCGRPAGKSGKDWGRRNPLFERPFCAWDGEGHDGKYTLLQNSKGDILSDPDGLSTERCLEFLAAQPPEYAHVWFAFGYDVNMILGDLSWDQLRQLTTTNHVHYRGYNIMYLDRHQFQVSKEGRKGSFNSWDVWGFFQSSFVAAIDAWGLGVPDIITEGKNVRGQFATWSQTKLTDYNAEECALLVRLMEELRRSIIGAGWSVARWDGPGALATHFFQMYDTKSHVADAPDDRIRNAAECAYFGGRIDAAGWGYQGGVHHYDIVSAYPAAMRFCPSLRGVRWTDERSDSPFQLALIRWKITQPKMEWGAFPFRTPKGDIRYPSTGEGWYWLPEIEAAQQRFGRFIKIRVIERIVPLHVDEYPLRDGIEQAFRYRKQLKDDGNMAHKAIRLALNSLYGKTAQNVAMGGKRPPYRCLFWAGYLTALTRAEIQKALTVADPMLVMTDSMFSRTPLPESFVSNDLGGWEYDGVNDFYCVSPGVYQYGDSVFSRGFEPDSFGGVKEIIGKFKDGTPSVPFTVRRFVGMRLALIGGLWRQHWRQFINKKRELMNPAFGGTTKRVGNGYRVIGFGIKQRQLRDFHALPPRQLDAETGSLSQPYRKHRIVNDVVRAVDDALKECND